MEKIDWVGKWFGVLQELGELVYIPFGKLTSDHNDLEWIFLPHEKYDGVGGITHLLRNEGYSIEHLPEMKDPKPPGFLMACLAYLRAAYESRYRYMPWKKYDPTKTGKFLGIAWHRFTEEETKQISVKAKELGISSNTLLFWNLDQAILPLFKTQNFDRQWMVPVNMRGGVKRTRETSNHSSFFGVSVSPGDSVKELHRKIHQQIKRNMHWGNWYFILTGKFLGLNGMRKSLARYRKKGHTWVGIFTNIGKWPNEDSETTSAVTTIWMVAATVTQGHPLAGACLTWKGQIGITLNFHPSLGMELNEFQAYMHTWKESVLSYIKS